MAREGGTTAETGESRAYHYIISMGWSVGRTQVHGTYAGLYHVSPGDTPDSAYRAIYAAACKRFDISTFFGTTVMFYSLTPNVPLT